MESRKIFACLSTCRLLWNKLWSVSRYMMGPLSGRWRLCGNDQQCLAAAIWKYRSGFGDHRFTFFIDLLPSYKFYTNLTNIVHWVVFDKDVGHLITLNLGKVKKRYAKSFEACLTALTSDWLSRRESGRLLNYDMPVSSLTPRFLRLFLWQCAFLNPRNAHENGLTSYSQNHSTKVLKAWMSYSLSCKLLLTINSMQTNLKALTI